MERKGQAALEYLMTYGWALIVIAIVVGVLVYIMSSTTGGATCTSNDTSIIIKDQAISGTSINIQAQNAYGRTITFTATPTGAGDLAGTYSEPGTTDTEATGSGSGSEFTITGTLNSAPQGAFSGTISIPFDVSGGVSHTVTISCSGTV